MWRIKNELGEGSPISPHGLRDVPIAPSAISEIVNAEAEYLKTKQSDYQREKGFLERRVRNGDHEGGVRSEQQKKEDQRLQSDLEERQKATDRLTKRSVTNPRVTDTRL